jgi:hypothetical protein
MAWGILSVRSVLLGRIERENVTPHRSSPAMTIEIQYERKPLSSGAAASPLDQRWR